MSARPVPAAASESPARNILRTVLPNGLLVLTESIPHVRSVSMGVWIRSGSRDEPLELNGISHFVEHMVFKGTTTRNARQFAREVDSIGGNLDAFTGKENICFNIKVLDDNIAPALELLSDLVLHPTFTPEDISRIRGVVEQVYIDDKIKDYIVNLVFATREPVKAGLKDLDDFIEYGASPRASIYLSVAARAHAFLRHRGFVTPEDVKAIGFDVMRHRVSITYEAEAEELTSEKILQKIFDRVEVP